MKNKAIIVIPFKRLAFFKIIILMTKLYGAETATDVMVDDVACISKVKEFNNDPFLSPNGNGLDPLFTILNYTRRQLRAKLLGAFAGIVVFLKVGDGSEYTGQRDGRLRDPMLDLEHETMLATII